MNKEINKNFKKILKEKGETEDKAGWSSWMCFADAIDEKGYTDKVIEDNFSLVDEDDYRKSEKEQCLKYLKDITRIK